MNIRKHLADRCLDPLKYRAVLDEDRDIATFMLWDLSGRLVGYQQYNPAGTKSIRNDENHRDQLKYFTYVGDEGVPGDGKKKLAAWGFESFTLNERIMFVAEGIFDAVKIHNAGYPALAVITNDPKHLRAMFKALGRTVIAICDDDDAGRRLASCAHLSFKVPTPYHDLGDMDQESVNSWLESITKSINS